MCGIGGVYSALASNVFGTCSTGIDFLKRRGPDSYGYSVINPEFGDILTLKHIVDKDDELNEARRKNRFFSGMKANIHAKNARMALFQSRYSTDCRTYASTAQGKGEMHSNAQPMEINYSLGDIIQRGTGVFNGNIPKNAKDVMKDMVKVPSHNDATVDTKSFTELFMQKLREYPRGEFGNEHYFAAAEWMMRNIDGAFSFIYSDAGTMVSFKDRWTIRPLCIGENGDTKILTSESGLFHHLGNIHYRKEVAPAEAVLIDGNGTLESRILNVPTIEGSCRFEKWYLQAFNSLCIDGGKSVDAHRIDVGRAVAAFYSGSLKDMDFCVSTPRSGDSFTNGFAYEAHLLRREAVFKDSDIRNFLVARNAENLSEVTIDHKFGVQGIDVYDKEIAVVDDSIIRGDTIAKLYINLKKNGVEKVNFYSMWPPTLYLCDKGIDISTDEQLLANELIHTGVITESANGVSYNIHEVNQEITKLVRERVYRISGGEFGGNDLDVYYAPMDLVDSICKGGGCSRCYSGKELPGWTG